MVFAYFEEGVMNDIRFDGKLDCKIDNIGYVSVSRDENFIFEYKNGKERYSFIYVEEGALEYYFVHNNLTLRIDKGTFLFIPSKLPYKTKYLKKDTIIRIIIFDVIADIPPAYFMIPIAKKSAELSSVFFSITEQNMRNTLFLSAKIYELMYYMQNESMDVPKKYKQILPALNHIKQYYYENRKIAYYATLCNMSESNFRLLFKQYTGKSPIDFRNAIRIAEVKKMIDSGEFTVSEAAYRAGFHNMSFFYEVYNKVTR